MQFFNTLALISSCSILVPFIAGTLNRKTMSSKTIWFYYFIVLTVPFEILSLVTALYKINNLALINIFNLLEFCFLATILIRWMVDISIQKLILINGLILIWWAWNIYTFGISHISSYVTVAENICLLLLAGAFLVTFVKNIDLNPLTNSTFWIAISIFIYFTSTIVLFTFAKYIFTPNNLQITKYYVCFHSIVNISCNIIFAYAFICKRKTLITIF